MFYAINGEENSQQYEKRCRGNILGDNVARTQSGSVKAWTEGGTSPSLVGRMADSHRP